MDVKFDFIQPSKEFNDAFSDRRQYVRHVGGVNRYAVHTNQYYSSNDFNSFLYSNNLLTQDHFRLVCVKNNLSGVYKDIAKYAKPDPYDLVLGDLDVAKAIVIEIMRPIWTNVPVATFADVFEHINGKTTPGFPWSKLSSQKSKVMVDPIFVDYFDNVYMPSLLEVSNRPKCIFSIFPKEELRPTVKVVSNKLRAVCASPLEHTIALNRYFLWQNKAFYDANCKFESAVGIDPFHNGWSDMRKQIKSEYGVDFDVGQWDSSLREIFLQTEKEIRLEFLPNLDTDDLLRIDNLYNDITATLMVMPLGELIRKVGGNPSGQGNTTVTNTIVHLLLWCYFFVRLGKGTTLSSFRSWVKLFLYGDDCLCASKDIVPKYIVSLYKECGFDAVVLTGYVKVDDLVFLQKRFHRSVDGSIGFVPVDGEKAISSLQLCKHHSHPAFELQRACGLRIYYFNDVKVFNIITNYVTFLLNLYDVKLKDDNEWVVAKTSILTLSQIYAIHFRVYQGKLLNYQPDKKFYVTQI